jgi:hypothetical protein
LSWADARNADENAGDTKRGEQGQKNDRKNRASGKRKAGQAFDAGEFMARTAAIEDYQSGQYRTHGEDYQFRPTYLEPLNQWPDNGGHEQETGDASQRRIADDTLQGRLDFRGMSGQVHGYSTARLV